MPWGFDSAGYVNVFITVALFTFLIHVSVEISSENFENSGYASHFRYQNLN